MSKDCPVSTVDSLAQTNAPYGYSMDFPLDAFDAEFFGISGKEAEALDPQQRLLLEVVYEALEDGGISLDDMSGSRTAVYCGSLGNEYAHVVGNDVAHYPRHSATGQGGALLANRVSYFYNCLGPSISIDHGVLVESRHAAHGRLQHQRRRE